MARVGPNQHDVLIVGGGAAGLRACLAITETNPDLSVAVISKVYPMRSHTVSAEGGAAGVIKDDDSQDDHAYDTISGSDWLCDQDAVEAFVKEAPEELLRLEHWGCPWSREEDGSIAVRSFGGMKIKRTWYAADKTGFHLLHTLFQTTLQYDPVHRYEGRTIEDPYGEHINLDLTHLGGKVDRSFPGGQRANRIVMPVRKNNDPFWWTLFGAGRTLAAFLSPSMLYYLG